MEPTSSWRIFRGDNRKPEPEAKPWKRLPKPPPWRNPATAGSRFVLSEKLLDAINVALHLRRPLLLTGTPGWGKSTLVQRIAMELALGDPLVWHITSRSTLSEALYQYDALGRLYATQSGGQAVKENAEVQDFVLLGPLGTALADQDRPRAVLIDEIDKSDFDLPNDLLNVLEDGVFEIPPLARAARHESGPDKRQVLGADRCPYPVTNGLVERTHWPVIVMTSNGERSFPAPFLRRCVRFDMPAPDERFIADIVTTYLGDVADTERRSITEFAKRLRTGEILAVDQLLNFVHLVSEQPSMPDEARRRARDMLLAELDD
ncbi:ATPase AAA [Actinoplanes italicus]|uniref:Dynein-related subfamily AAA family protein n=1 Tax=Actinoplanes italicus TaxID=113567 RepID=A0A2T0K409_9ACTN|nr:AAA family ATPase [Actinoplanes italicus]PRX17360.1 dynein-related subfamily AAA family protein [Actinoplanes italicus]GIE36747.1 ATPase AAA [Actinoplanes italicus]